MANWGEIFARAFSESYGNAQENALRTKQRDSEASYRQGQLDLGKQENALKADELKFQTLSQRTNMLTALQQTVAGYPSKFKNKEDALQDWNKSLMKKQYADVLYGGNVDELDKFITASLDSAYTKRAEKSEAMKKNLGAFGQTMMHPYSTIGKPMLNSIGDSMGNALASQGNAVQAGFQRNVMSPIQNGQQAFYAWLAKNYMNTLNK